MDINLNVNAGPGNLSGSTAVAGSPRQESSKSPEVVADTSQNEVQTLDQAVESLQKLADMSHRNLDFSIDEGSGQTVVKVVASDTGEVIRQIPSEVALKLAQSLKDADGLLFNGMA